MRWEDRGGEEREGGGGKVEDNYIIYIKENTD